MAQWIALLRGINVGGHGRLPMKSLAQTLEGIGASDVQTYIQSGNVVFESAARSAAKLAAEINAAIEAEHGFAPAVLALRPKDLAGAIAANPFAEKAHESDGKALHLLTLAAAPKSPDLGALEQATHATESWKIIGRFMYLYAPNGLHKSKVAAKAERAVGVTVTARNWRTVSKIAGMCR